MDRKQTLEPFTWVLVFLAFVIILCVGFASPSDLAAALELVNSILLILALVVLWQMYHALILIIEAIYDEEGKIKSGLLAVLQRLRRQVKER